VQKRYKYTKILRVLNNTTCSFILQKYKKVIAKSALLDFFTPNFSTPSPSAGKFDEEQKQNAEISLLLHRRPKFATTIFCPGSRLFL